MNTILHALGKELPADVPLSAQPAAEPLEELVLELTDLRFYEQDGVRRASASARLVYEPATLGQAHVQSQESWRLVAPIGPIEAEELRWYLEKYAIWPSHYFRDRARNVEEDLVKWGCLLYEAAMPLAQTTKVLHAWERLDAPAGRRFSVHVDAALEAGSSEADAATAKAAATLLLGLPWELLHDGKSYLFHGAKPTRVRRRLPGPEALAVPVVATPIRILLVTARPEDEACGYIDHRVSALPLVEAMESLPGLVQLHLLSPPTLPAMREELDRAHRERQPYHVVHFDGHGVYDPGVGQGGLCFEHPGDVGRVEQRRHITVYSNELGALLRAHRIPLLFLEACQTAQAESASESVASELLRVGMASVVAMSHSVLVETARRFVGVFYRALAEGRRVGDAMLEGQWALEGDKSRGRMFGLDELQLHDWFVPVLYQERDDPQLFTTVPARQTREDFRAALAARLGNLPPEPETGFVGRSRDLLALQRLLRSRGARYAVVRGQGGEGKTTLATELARWMVRSHQICRAAFVSVEGLEKNVAESVLNKLGDQLVRRGFSTQADCQGDLEKAELEIQRTLSEQPTLLVMDNMESVLLPPFIANETPEILQRAARDELTAILALCSRLLEVGETRLVFTSREALPAPFDGELQRRELQRLDLEDAVKLVERVVSVADDGLLRGNAAGDDMRIKSRLLDARQEAIEQLVDAVHCHARTLALLAPALRSHGVESTHRSLVELMTELEEQFPGSREQSVFASVELSLRRMSEANRDRARVLGIFHGTVDLEVLRHIMDCGADEVASLADELVETGLATADGDRHLTLNPALSPYLRRRIDATEQAAITARWVGVTFAYVRFLVQQQHQNTELAASLTVLELPNLLALLDHVDRNLDSKLLIMLATWLFSLLRGLGKPRLLERVGQVRDAAMKSEGQVWDGSRFEAMRAQVEQQLASGRLRDALGNAQELLKRARTAGAQAYPSAEYDLAMACVVMAEALRTAGGAGRALPLLDEARQRFQTLMKDATNPAPELMLCRCLDERGLCLLFLGRFQEAAAALEEGFHRATRLGNKRQAAICTNSLGLVRMRQERYREALKAFTEAREQFVELHEPATVAGACHHAGAVYEKLGQPEAAEDAYREALALNTEIGNIVGQAGTLAQLGNLYHYSLRRSEEAVAFHQQAAAKFAEVGDAANEGRTRSSLGDALRAVGRFNEARREIHRAITCTEPFGHSTEPWRTWATLADIEASSGNPTAASEAKAKATHSFLAFRRDGGESHDGPARLVFDMMERFRSGGPASAAAFLEQLAAARGATDFLPSIRALQSIVAGSRDRALAEAPALHYSMAAEILFLLEMLESR